MFVIGIIEVLNFNYISIDRNFVSRLLKIVHIYVVTSLSDFIKTFHICNNPANAVSYKWHWVMVIQMEEYHRKTHELLDKTRAISMLPTFLTPPQPLLLMWTFYRPIIRIQNIQSTETILNNTTLDISLTTRTVWWEWADWPELWYLHLNLTVLSGRRGLVRSFPKKARYDPSETGVSRHLCRRRDRSIRWPT